MPVNINQLRGMLSIDKTMLDDEIIRQPSLFYEVSEMLTEAQAERDAAKEELAIVDADLDRHYRAQLGKNGNKVTEGMVTSHLQTDDKHKEAFTDYLALKNKADQLLALKEAFQQRSYMLRDLVSLYTANYFESESVKPSRAQEASHYAVNRQRIANARQTKAKRDGSR